MRRSPTSPAYLAPAYLAIVVALGYGRAIATPWVGGRAARGRVRSS